MYGVTGSSFAGSSIRKIWFSIQFLIYFKVAFDQAFLTYSSAKFMGSGMKCDTSEPDSTNSGNELFN